MDQRNPEELLRDIHRQLKDLTEKVESAFLKDEYGEVDYVGHRIQHRKQADSEKEYKASRNAIIKNIISWLIIGVLTIIGTSITQLYLSGPKK